MIQHEHIAAKWWRWWANPLEGLHPSRFVNLEAQSITASVHHRYEIVSRVRRIFMVPVVPDQAMTDAAHKLLSPLLDHETLCKGLAGLGCLAMGDSILTARSQDWEDLHGVQNNDIIRDLVSSLRTLSPVLQTIRLEVLSHLSIDQDKPLTLQEAVHVVLGMYYREFSLSLYTRWSLTISEETEEKLSAIQRLNKEHTSEFLQWVEGRLNPLIDRFQASHDIPMLDLNELREDHAESA